MAETPAPSAPAPDDAPKAAKSRRVYLHQTRLGLALMAASIALMHFGTFIGEAPGLPVLWWSLASFGGLAAIYLAIHLGWTRRFSDPALTLAQMSFAITSSAAAYTLLGPSRGAVFPVLAVVLMFGMFQDNRRGIYAVSLYALALFALAMGWMAWTQPTLFVPQVELGHFITLACMLPAVAAISVRVVHIRTRLREQKRELSLAVEKIAAMATRDELTGLFNRRRMQELLEIEVARAGRARHRFCLAMLDIDHFKRVNDQHGHAVGDRVLRAFSQTALQAIREGDILARWGGEEFVLLFTDTRLATATVGAERLREQVAGMRMAMEDGTPLRITVSAGLVEFRKGEGLPSLLDRADQLLYEAKETGRNRVVSLPNTTTSMPV